jgi:geranylgeranyl diphosphate synthase type II
MSLLDFKSNQFQKKLKSKQQLVDKALHFFLKKQDYVPVKLHRSMEYSIFSGGKRLRPILCLAVAETIQLQESIALRLACALELIHTYSLIHDDLPALDDDDFRRGRRTNHVVFGEALAILSGDALLTLAFQILADYKHYPSAYQKNIPAILYELAKQAGYTGMVGGQVEDILSEHVKPSFQKVINIHRGKTGALFLASVRIPAILKGKTSPILKSLTLFGEKSGLAFQIIDDILNEVGNVKIIGKKTGSDLKKGKLTFPKVIGIERSREKVKQLTQEAIQALEPLGEKTAFLKTLALYMANRSF